MVEFAKMMCWCAYETLQHASEALGFGVNSRLREFVFSPSLLLLLVLHLLIPFHLHRLLLLLHFDIHSTSFFGLFLSVSYLLLNNSLPEFCTFLCLNREVEGKEATVWFIKTMKSCCELEKEWRGENGERCCLCLRRIKEKQKQRRFAKCQNLESCGYNPPSFVFPQVRAVNGDREERDSL